MNFYILKKKNFSLLMTGKLLSLVGTEMQSFALSLYVLKITGSATKFASVLAVTIIPQIVLGPFAGVLVDWFNRKKMIIYLDLLNGLILLPYVYIYYAYSSISLTSIYILVIMLAIISVFYNPALNTIIPTIIEKDYLVDANGINSLIMNIGNIIAPLIAGVLFGFYGLSIILIINAFSFIMSAVCEMFLNIPTANQKPESISLKVFFNDFLEGLKFIKNKDILLVIIILGALVNFAYSPIFSVGITYISKQILKVTDYQYGILQSFFIISMVFAPFLCSSVSKKLTLGKILFFDIFINSILIAIMALFVDLRLIWGNFSSFISLLIIGFMIQLITGIGNIALSTMIQKEIPLNLLGRINSAISMGLMIAVPLGQIVFGVLFDKLPADICLIISAFILFISILLLRKKLTSY
ncbi:MFS transporter [Clostridium sp. JN-9]|uniref:MFS transporter n=1 Tax=Clostridium sp. JN-9 TaxID=2507159 RepID=UPI0013E8F471|nr:MFS transporter [Clostridium sp. JN-9]